MNIGKCLVALVALVLSSCATFSNSAGNLRQDSKATLERLYRSNEATRDLIARSAGVLVFPRILKAGVAIGGEYGEGVLMEGGAVVGYYNIAGGSIGFQLGAQKRAHVIAFMDPAALDRFVHSEGWQAGVDGSVVVADLGRGGTIDTKMVNKPILGFVLGEAGLMYNATIEGAKITQIKK